jgi:hypothetical protein
MYRRQPAAGEISEAAAGNVRMIADTVYDKAEDVRLNNQTCNVQRRRK